jgi:uncharacterized membrane protein YfcA
MIALIVLFVSSILAGFANAVAGGGTFFSFPALTGIGLTSLVANATNAVAVTPGHALAAWTYRTELGRAWGRLAVMAIASGIGAIGGAFLLTITPVKTFAALVPWLVLFATVSFAFGPALQKAIQTRKAAVPLDPFKKKTVTPGAAIIYMVASIYGGYFGAGQGIVLMTVLTLTGVDDIQEANAFKNAIAALCSLIAVIILAFKGIIVWKYGILMIVGATIGGLLGGKFAQRLDKKTLRAIVIVIGSLLTVWYFYKG